jgi:hypothetical protein
MKSESIVKELNKIEKSTPFKFDKSVEEDGTVFFFVFSGANRACKSMIFFSSDNALKTKIKINLLKDWAQSSPTYKNFPQL